MIPAVAYYRMSTDRQDKSIPEQRDAVVEYAKKNGYTILREYLDEGISGDATERRAGFQRMSREAIDKRDFLVILCWDQDRFGRFDLMEAGYWIKPLRDVGVRLVTIAQGEIDWSDFAGRMIYGIQQEGKHQFLVDLSRNSTRGLKKMAQEGQLVGSTIPFGFDKIYLDGSGREVCRVARGERGITKQKGWRVKLVHSKNRDEVKLVRWLFATYAEGGTSLRGLVHGLNAKGILSPYGTKWRVATVRKMFLNPIYVGDACFGRTTSAKYHHICRDEVRKIRGPKPTGNRDKQREEWIVVPDVHEALVDREVWKSAQDQLNQRRNCSTPMHKHGDKFLLSGLLYCGRCGKRLVASFFNKTPHYVCQSYSHFGKKSGCGGWTVRQDDLFAFLIDVLETQIFAGGNLDVLKTQIHARLQQQVRSGPEVRDRLRKRIVELDREIARAADRFLTAPENLTEVLAPQIESRRRQREGLQTELDELERLSQPADVRAEAAKVAGRFSRLREDLLGADRTKVRALLRRLISRVDLHWGELQHLPSRRRKGYPLEAGELTFAAAISTLQADLPTHAR